MLKSKTEKVKWLTVPSLNNLDHIDPLCQLMVRPSEGYKIYISRDLKQTLQVLEGVSLLQFGTDWYICNDPGGHTVTGLEVRAPGSVGMEILTSMQIDQPIAIFGIERSNHLYKNRPMYKIIKLGYLDEQG